jgi:purine-nucleoside phosphorylase
MSVSNEYNLVQESVEFLKSKIAEMPRVGIILGTGLGGSLERWAVEAEILYRQIPHVMPAHVLSHSGKVFLAKIENVPVIIFSGRVHYYEGYEMNDVVIPVRIMHEMGCRHLVVSNASGGLNPAFDPGDIVLIKDHISFFQKNPLHGTNEDRWGPRFPEIRNAYDQHWRTAVKNHLEKQGKVCKEGVYMGVPGPSLETAAECEFLHRMGGDLVGMSTIPEVIVARHMDMNVLGISVVANASYPPEKVDSITVESIVQVVEERSHEVGKIMEIAVQVLELKAT